MGRSRQAGLSSCVDWDPRAMDDGVDDAWAAEAETEVEAEAEQDEDGDDDEYEDLEEEEQVEEAQEESDEDSATCAALEAAVAATAAAAAAVGEGSFAVAGEGSGMGQGAGTGPCASPVFASSASTQTPQGNTFKGEWADAEWSAANGSELHMYYSNLVSLANVHRRKPNLTVLSLIGQPLHSLNGVEYLRHLKELWAVECELTDVQAVEGCQSLEKLYLYSNRISAVPRLDALSRLQVLWLASNSICDVRPVGGGRALLDLNLSKNRIASLSGGRWLRCRALRSLNLSGNPLFLLTDLLPLAEAPALKALQAADPMYGDSPVAQLCNYRSYVVHHVRNLESLEQLEVTEDERMAVDGFYAEKFLFYNMLRFHYKNLYMKEEKEHLYAFWRKMEALKWRKVRYTMEKLWGAQEEAERDCAPSAGGGAPSGTLQTRMEHLKYKLKVLSKDLKDWRKSHAVSLQTRLQQVCLEQQHAGNLRFRDFSGDSEPMVICQRLLDSYICSHLRKKMGIEATQLLEVTHVTNKGLEVIADLRMGSKRRRSSSIMLLAPGGGLRHPSHWPFDVTKRGCVETAEYEVGVTNCLLYADRWWMEAAGHAKRVSSPALSYLAPTDSQYERRVAVVVIFSRDTLLVPCHRDHSDACSPRGCSPPSKEGDAARAGGAAAMAEGLAPQPASAFLPPGGAPAARRDRSCCSFLVASAQLVLAMIVLEFRYVFSDPLERFRQRMGWTADVHEQCAPVSGPGVQQLDEQNFQGAVARVRKALGSGDAALGALVHVTLVGCGIVSLGNLPCMPTVQTVNVSFNKLSSLKGLEVFSNARMVDVSYNEVTLRGDGDSLRGRMTQLRSLDLSWNCVGRLLVALPLLGRPAPQLAAFDSRHNPVEDLRDSLHAAFFAKKTFPLLLNFDGEHIDDLLQAKRDSGCNAVWGDVLDLQVWKKPAALNWTVETRMAGGEGCMGEPGAGTSPPFWVCHKGLYLMDVKVTPAFASVRWADFSDNLLSDVKGLLLALPDLEELSLRYNVIQTFPVLSQQWASLRKLDLSRNYLKSIATLQCGCFPALELLDVSGNMLSDLNGIQSCESLVECYAACNRIAYEASLLAAKSCRCLRMLDLTGNPVERRKDFRAFCVFHIPDLDYLNGQAVEESDFAEASDMFGGCLDRDFLIKTPCSLELSTLKSLTLANSALRKVNLPSGVLPQLERLDLSNNCLTFLWGLHTLPALKTLRLSYNQVTAMRPPTGSLPGDAACALNGAPSRCPTSASTPSPAAPAPPFPQLQMLLLDNNHVICCKLLGLREMPCLSTLFLQHNEIASFEGLQGLTSLRFLVLDDNKLQMITSADCRGLSEIEELWLENNRLSQLYFAKGLQKLRRLFLAGNTIGDVSQLKHLTNLKALKEVTLWGNPVTRRPNFPMPLREIAPSLELLDGELLEAVPHTPDSDSTSSR